MNKDPAFLFYSSDFLTGVSFFTNEETGLYIKMLCYQHQHGGIIPKKFFLDAIALLPNIKSKFIECDEGFFNERLMEEMEKRVKKSKTLSCNALIRWKNHKKCKSNAKVYAIAMQTEDENEDVNASLNSEEGMQGGKPKAEYSEDFLLFWKEYPKKHGKGAAWKEWVKERPHINQCLKTLEWQKKTEEWIKENWKYVPDPERWIKKRRWEDEQPKEENTGIKLTGY